MTNNDEWLRERAEQKLAERCFPCFNHNDSNEVRVRDAIVVALREAKTRSRDSILARLRDPDEVLVEAGAKALWRLECSRSDADERRAGRVLPAQWANPWHESGCGIRQQKLYMDEASASIRAIAAKLDEEG